jgi:hypothetical protein
MGAALVEKKPFSDSCLCALTLSLSLAPIAEKLLLDRDDADSFLMFLFMA